MENFNVNVDNLSTEEKQQLMKLINKANRGKKRVEFISYDGAYPNLCSGLLVLKINGKVKEFPRYCLHSGGGVWFDDNWCEHIESGPWSIDLPDDLEPLRQQIEKCINENIPHGCCGGCI